MKQFRMILAALLLAMAALPAFSAEKPAKGRPQRFAVVNLEKVFQEYYKSRIAEDAIKQQAEVFRNSMMRLNEELRTLKEEARTARINMDNIALSEAERAESRKNAEKKTRQVAEKEADIELYMNQRNTEMRKIVQAKREGIIADIKKEIQRQATAEGYDFVLDSSSKTLSEQPDVLLFPELDDLTSQVITELNRSRTVPAPASARRETPPATDLLK